MSGMDLKQADSGKITSRGIRSHMDLTILVL
jgi:hypothetical protein